MGIDKGLATNPLLGTGLVAGFRTSGESERPGFAWFFGRDALWTTLATNADGDFATTRTALEFLRRYQRQDGKIPHEISQSASLVPWFDQYPYAWASADATPLYVIAHAEYFRATGDRDFLERELGLDREGVALLRGHRHRRQRPHREHEVRTWLGGRQPSLSAARGDLPPGDLDRGLVAWPRRARGG